ARANPRWVNLPFSTRSQTSPGHLTVPGLVCGVDGLLTRDCATSPRRARGSHPALVRRATPLCRVQRHADPTAAGRAPRALRRARWSRSCPADVARPAVFVHELWAGRDRASADRGAELLPASGRPRVVQCV